MVNVIDNGARNRTNMMPVGIKVIDDKGNVAYTAKTDLGTNYISLESKWFGSSSNNTGGSTGGNIGGNTDPNNPGPTAAGANYHAGSLANGEITQRNFEWGGTDDPTKSNTITFKDAQGSKFNGNYDGIQLLGHIQKTVVTNGVAGTVTDLPLNRDVNNVVKSGCYTTSASYPIYINNFSINVGSVAFVPIIGIGENLGGKNVKAPSISLTLNADMTLALTHNKGYNNDGASLATGVDYQFIVDTISTYSVQKGVSQLPASVNLFSGTTADVAVLSGASTYFENVMDGIELTFDPNFSILAMNDNYDTFTLKDIGLDQSVRIPKQKLISGLSVKAFDETKLIQLAKFSPSYTGYPEFRVANFANNQILIGNGKITINISINTGHSQNENELPDHLYPTSFKLIKVTPYKE